MFHSQDSHGGWSGPSPTKCPLTYKIKCSKNFYNKNPVLGAYFKTGDYWPVAILGLLLVSSVLYNPAKGLLDQN